MSNRTLEVKKALNETQRLHNEYGEWLKEWIMCRDNAERALARSVEEYLRHGTVRGLKRMLRGTPYSVECESDVALLCRGSYLISIIYGVRP